jgi:hypothetical protein
VFVESSPGVWQLAGINYLVEGPFSGTPNGALFNGSMFDLTGLYEDQGPNIPRLFFPDTGIDQPSASFVSSISGNMSFIQTTISAGGAIGSVIPEPSAALLLMCAMTWSLKRSRRTRAA